MWYLSFPFWLPSLHPCCCKWHYFVLFLWLSSIPLYICTTSSLSIPLSMDIYNLIISSLSKVISLLAQTHQLVPWEWVGLCPWPVAVVMWWQLGGSVLTEVFLSNWRIGQIIPINKCVFSVRCSGSFPQSLIKAVDWAMPEPHSEIGQVTFGMWLKPPI